MADNSTIEWTEATWNPATGCSKISPGCQHCYAERMARRLQAMGQPHYVDGFAVRTHEDALGVPFRWRKPRTIFVNSMSDLFHVNVPTDFVLRVFEVMRQCPQHTFQVLTKRSDRLRGLSRRLTWPHNVWMGVSVESEGYLYRIDDLVDTAARVKFISFEPLLGPIRGLRLGGIDWAIVGGESGPGARPMAAEWAETIRDVCLMADVPFFFKQWGGRNKKKAGRVLDGRTWDEMPLLAQAQRQG